MASERHRTSALSDPVGGRPPADLFHGDDRTPARWRPRRGAPTRGAGPVSATPDSVGARCWPDRPVFIVGGCELALKVVEQRDTSGASHRRPHFLSLRRLRMQAASSALTALSAAELLTCASSAALATVRIGSAGSRSTMRRELASLRGFPSWLIHVSVSASTWLARRLALRAAAIVATAKKTTHSIGSRYRGAR